MPPNKQIIFTPPDPAWGKAEDTHIHIVLVHPEIPANTGNIARLCACTGVILHLIEPLGFKLEDRYLRRAGLDYWPRVTLCVHPDWPTFEAIFSPDRLHLMTTKGTRPYPETASDPGSVFVFGRETRGLEPEIREAHSDKLFRIPICEGNRSLNLANACSIVLYDVRRRQGFPNMA